MKKRVHRIFVINTFLLIITYLCMNNIYMMSPAADPFAMPGAPATPASPTPTPSPTPDQSAAAQPLQAPLMAPAPADQSAITPPATQPATLPTTGQSAAAQPPQAPLMAPAPTDQSAVTPPAAQPAAPQATAQQPPASLPTTADQSVAAQPTQPAPVQPTAPTTTDQSTVTPAAPQTPAQPTQPAIPQKDLDQITTIITTIKTLKSTIQDQLKDIDDKIYEARMLDAQAKKLSFTILNAASEAEASQILNQVNEASGKIKNLEDKIKGEMSKNIDDQISQIQTNMQTLETTVKKLEDQGISFQMKEFAALETAPAKTTDKPVVLAKKLEMPPPAIEQKTFLHHIADIFINLIVGIIRAIGNLFSFLKNIVMPSTPQTTVAQALPQQQAQKQASTQATMPLSTPTSGDNEVKKKVPESVTTANHEQFHDETIQKQLEQSEHVLNEIDQSHKELSEKFNTIQKPSKEVVSLATSNPAVQAALAEKSDEEPLIEPNSKFKQTAVSTFGTLMDGFIAVINGVTHEIKEAYHYISRQVSSKLTREAVEEKAEKQAQPQEQNIPQASPTEKAPADQQAPLMPVSSAPTAM